MNYSTYTYTNQGGRTHNEDSIALCQEDDCCFCLVADGLGGHKGGAMASDIVATTMMNQWKDNPPSDQSYDQRKEWLEQVIGSTNETLLEAQVAQGNTMKSTLACLELFQNRATWAHVGDSRIFFLTDGHIFHATQDHSVTYKKFIAGDITKEEINFDEDRSSLLRVVGDKNRCTPNVDELPLDQPLKEGDAFLICSDGFWEWIFDGEILLDFLKSPTPESWVTNMLVRILPRKNSEHDNLSAVAVFVEAT